MRIPINIRITSIGQRVPGGDDYVTVTGHALAGDTLFTFEIQRRLLAEQLAHDARQGVATGAELRQIDEGEPQPQDAEQPEPKTVAIHI